jgi:hypothetical protein
MRKFLFMLLIVAFVCTASTVYAAQKAPLGTGNLAVKLDWIKFTDSVLKDADVNSGFYFGLEGYGMMSPNWYLGLEAGYANPDGSITEFEPGIGNVTVDNEVTYVPIELNVKYAAAVAQSVVFDIGAGVCYNYVEEKASSPSIGVPPAKVDDWLFGGQFFMDLNYTINQFFLGISGKYQITQSFKDADYNYNNWRLGGQIGVMF